MQLIPEGIQFLNPSVLMAVPVLILLLAFLYWTRQRRRTANAKRVVNFDLLETAEKEEGGRWRRHVPFVLALAGVATLIVSLAWPVYEQRVAYERSRVILAFDNSLSTGAVEEEDGQTRLVREQAQALEIVESARDGDELALVAFADEAVLSVEPTTDKESLRQVISNLQPEVETDLGGALLEAHRLAQGSPVASHVIVISDGAASTDTSVDMAIERLKDDGIAVSTYLVGTRGGFTLENGVRRPFPAQPETLERISAETGGIFVNGDGSELREVYTNLERTVRFEVEMLPVRHFPLLALALLLVSFLIAMNRRPTVW
jgi:Ca-activated chloride channel family protein